MTERADRSSGYYNAESELMNPEKRDEILIGKFKEIVPIACSRLPDFKTTLDRAELKPENIRSISDLEHLPILPESDLNELTPDGISDESFGLYSWMQALFAAGIRPGDTGQVVIKPQMTALAEILDSSLLKMGCLSVPTGIGDLEFQLGIMKDLKPETCLGAQELFMEMKEKIETMGLDPEKDFGLEFCLCVGGKLSGGVREQLEAGFGAIVRQVYGNARIGCLGYECYHKCGLHYSDNVIIEIVDPDTGQQLKVGEKGEVVVTVLDEADPLIRFRTGDAAFYTDEPCACGRTSRRLMDLSSRLHY